MIHTLLAFLFGFIAALSLIFEWWEGLYIWVRGKVRRTRGY